MTNTAVAAAFGVLLLADAAIAQPKPVALPAGEQLMQAVEARPFGTDQVATVTIVVTPKSGAKRVRNFVLTRKQFPGAVKLVAHFKGPPGVAGSAFLVEDNASQADTRWIYSPAIGQPRQLASTDGRASFFASDLTYEELTHRDPQLDTHRFIGMQRMGKWDCWVVESKPNVRAGVEFARYRTWIWKDDPIVLRQELYDDSGKAIRRTQVLGLQKIQNIWTVGDTTFTNVKTGSVTSMRVANVQYDTGVSSAIFTPAGLQPAAPAVANLPPTSLLPTQAADSHALAPTKPRSEPQVSLPTGAQLMDAVEDRPFGTDQVADMTLEIRPKAGAKRVHQFTLMRKQFAGATKVVTSASNAAVLVEDVEGQWDNRWLYVPADGQARKLASTDARSSLFESDLTYEDLTNRDPGLDAHALLRAQKLGSWDCWVVESKPRGGNGELASYRTWIWKDDPIVIRQELYDTSGKLIRRSEVASLRKVQNVWTILSTIVTNVKTGSRTTLNLANVQYDTGISGAIFTPAHLETGLPAVAAAQSAGASGPASP